MNLSDLTGVGPVYVKKLNNAGINGVMDLIVRGPVEVAEVTGMESATATKICNTAREFLAEEGIIAKDFISATDVYKRRQSLEKIPTGTEAFDKLLDGGIECGSLTEVYGEFGSGKTQFCHTICVMVQKHLGGKVLYIDTENTFRPERIVKIAEINKVENALENIIVARAYNSAHQILIMEEASKIIEKENIKLIVADSGTGLFRAEYLGRGTLSSRQQKLNHFFHLLVKTAEIYSIAVIVTNQVMHDPGQFFGDPTKAIGGNVVAHTSTYRIYFKKSGKKRIARMVDSPHHAEEEIIFMLTEAGISDVEEEKK